MLIGEAQGEAEVKIGKGFVGASGIELLRMLSESGVIAWTETDQSYLHKYYNTGDPHLINMIWNLHPEVYRSNVFQLHPPGNNLEAFCGPKTEGIAGYPALIKGKFVRREFEPQLDRLADEILSIDPNLIICLGNSALWALSGRTGVSKLRGTTLLSSHCVSDYKCLVAYHPAAILRQWENRPVTLIDLSKAVYERDYPEVRRPFREIWIEPDLDDIERFINERIIRCPLLSVDIETDGNQISKIGFSPRKEIALVVPFHDARRKSGSYWESPEAERKCWDLIRRVLEDRTILKLFQNGLFDVAFIWRSTGIKVMGANEDSMLLSHALQPESLKGLGFLGSVYTDEGPWKHDHKASRTIKRDA